MRTNEQKLKDLEENYYRVETKTGYYLLYAENKEDLKNKLAFLTKEEAIKVESI